MSKLRGEPPPPATPRSSTPEPAAAAPSQAPPTPTLPKGGGAIRGIGEKLAANPVTGTGSMSVPLATSPGRSGFGPQLALSYDSGSGNGPFGFGWSLAIPSISRKTDKGLPQYLDRADDDAEESDVYVLSGAEDLVPLLLPDGKRFKDDTSVPGVTIHPYRPRVEGLFARIERWTDQATGEVHWRSITPDNVTTLYGQDNDSRIFDPAGPDPAHPTRIFSWLLCQSHDDKGNAIVYKYAAEDDKNVDRSLVNERNRVRTANRYLKRIWYGNRVSRLLQPDLSQSKWMFEVVFDYEEGHYEELDPDPSAPETGQPRRARAAASGERGWTVRPDPFSSHRAGFEVRTYRRCRRMLMFHHFDELGNEPCLVRSTEFEYVDLDYTQPLTVEAELAHPGSTRFTSFLRGVTQSGFIRDEIPPVLERDGARYVTYLRKSLPPLEFEYSKAIIQDDIRDLDAGSLENLPIGLDGVLYRWVDLDGEGVSGILTEQAGAWFYKRNLGDGRFGPLETIPTRPSLAALSGGRQQLLDLAGDGQLDLVAFDGPAPGFFERTPDEDWELFKAFASLPNISWGEPNLRFVDLDGDGHADVLITEDEAFTWYPSLAEEGFGPARQVRQALDEERGPRLVLADGTQSIYLADMCGDGLADLVRLRNGEVCYWPNQGYGRFGAKVTMDDAPWFDHPDQFDQQRVRLADIDGSGAIDILYLGRDGVRLYFNQSGNRWSAPRRLRDFPRVDDLSSVTTVDLLGNGTACLVWSSALPGDARRPLRYIDLMGGQKPHLLIRSVNNLGAETRVQYAASTKFYLADKAAGKPWITRLPFPVHCVEKVTVTDKWRQAVFSSTYSYHHGYFDGNDREFRGFGRVQQIDVETFGKFAGGNEASPYITGDQSLYQPPVKTVTWYHTGAFLDRERVLSRYQDEYFPRGFEAPRPDERDVLGSFMEHELPEPDLSAVELTAEEWREALRACKGMVLRQEVYELDVDALEQGEQRPVRLFTTAYRNCRIRRLQPRAMNRHAVFLVTESEAITYHYELDLRPENLQPDPRIAHTLNLLTDDYGNVLESVAVAYPRRGRHEDSTLEGAEALIAWVQQERHLVFTENRFTHDVTGNGHYRLRQPCEVKTYELTGIAPREGLYYTLAELRAADIKNAVAEIPCHRLPDRAGSQKRLIEHQRILYFGDDLETPLPLGDLNHLGLLYETYRTALTDELLTAILGDKLPDLREAGETHAAMLDRVLREGGYYIWDNAWWTHSGIAGFAEGTAHRFYLPERYTDPFNKVTTLEYADYGLFLRARTDPALNRTEVTRFDFRVLAPLEIRDLNGNLSEVSFDILGLPIAMAVKGKGDEGDDLGGVPPDPDIDTLIRIFTGAYDEAEARRLLGNATGRHLYYMGERREADGSITYGHHPACAAGLAREIHLAQGGEGGPLQAAFEYSDGAGNVLVKKVQAEPEAPGGPLRWIANGKTVLNNKGKPVKRYEPYFSESEHRFEEPREVGVTPLMYYDAVGRLIRTELPDGTFSRVELSPWFVAAYDANDTVLEPGNGWYERFSSGTLEERRAASLAAVHADTPAVTHLDSLGREVVAIAHNCTPASTPEWANTPLLDRPWIDEKYLTYSKLDAEGKPLWIQDARGNRVMEYINRPGADTDYAPCYDIAGNLLFQHSMDAGDRWMLPDATGKPMFAWDVNDRIPEGGEALTENRIFHTRYDDLRRPLEQRLRINGGAWQVTERFLYGEGRLEDQRRNLRGQVFQHDDPSGRLTHARYDFKGNLLEVRRQLVSDHRARVIDWSGGSPGGGLAEIFTQRTEYDALNRMARLENWHLEGRQPAVYVPRYNARDTLQSETVTVRERATDAILNLEYDAKGQRTRIQYGNGTTTRYHYDPLTFRLVQLRTTRAGEDPRFPGHRSGLADPRVLQQLHYTYDPSGNITEVHDEAYEPVFFHNQIVEPRSLYTYDGLYRLIEATGRENGAATGAPSHLEGRAEPEGFPITAANALRRYTQLYQYDPTGNILLMQHQAGPLGSWTRRYEYAPDSNRLLRTWEGADSWSSDRAINKTEYHYDAHGSMLNLANVAPGQFLRWDYRDMIHSLDLVGGGWAYYNYDAGKQRTRKRVERLGGEIEERLYLGGMELYRRYGAGGGVVEEIETHHLFVEEQRVLIVEDVLRTDNSQLSEGLLYRYQYSNHLGSVGLELNDEAWVISYEEYHPYGTAAYRAKGRDIGATAKRYRHAGMERDEESGLSYHTARYYAAWLGRWGSADPGFDLDGLNLFQCFSNNPVLFVDPDGKQSRRAIIVSRLIPFVLLFSDADPEAPGFQGARRGAEPTRPQTSEERRGESVERRRRRGERSSVEERESRSQYPPDPPDPLGSPDPDPEPRRGRPTYPRPEEVRPPATRYRRTPATRGGGIGQGFGIGGRRSGGVGIGLLFTVLDLSLLATAVMAARSPQERLRIAGEFVLSTAAGMAAVRLLGGPLALGLSMFSIPTDSPTSERDLQEIREIRSRELWRQHVDEIALRLAQHLQQLDAELGNVEAFLDEFDRAGSVMSTEYLESRLRELTSQLTTAGERIAEDLEQVSRQDLPYIRQQLLQRGVSEELIQETLRTR